MISRLVSKGATALWFARRPSHWAHGLALARRKLQADHDTPALRAQARARAAQRAVRVADALTAVGLSGDVPVLDPALVAEGEALAELSSARMGGSGDLDLLYAAVRMSGARRVLETGVAYGWSSLAILAALEGRDGARLVSVDMAYPKMGNEAFVGLVVPERMRRAWTRIPEPDRRGLEKRLRRIGGTIDLCHYDSDKSW